MNRLILFDIDGTLVAGGPAKEAFHDALLEVFGTVGPIRDWDFSGKTDPQIARELLSADGLDAVTIEAGFPALWNRYLGELERRLPARPTRLLPGLVPLMEALRARADVALGLVTGNMLRGAELKLAPVGLAGHFPVGGFGSDHEQRNELPGIALARARAHWGIEFDPDHVIVVGDTPRDVECGKHHGTRTLGVATGRFSVTELRESGADEVLEDLAETARVLEILTG